MFITVMTEKGRVLCEEVWLDDEDNVNAKGKKAKGMSGFVFRKILDKIKMTTNRQYGKNVELKLWMDRASWAPQGQREVCGNALRGGNPAAAQVSRLQHAGRSPLHAHGATAAAGSGDIVLVRRDRGDCRADVEDGDSDHVPEGLQPCPRQHAEVY
jgi:hypothetical protein